MGKLFGATHPIIKEGRVGEGGKNNRHDVKRINQLLRRAGFLKVGLADVSKWTKKSTDALIEFQEAQGLPANPYIDKTDPDDRLLALAQAAKVLMPVPGGLRSSSAFSQFFDHCRTAKYPYGWVGEGKTWAEGTHMWWGFEGRWQWAVATEPNVDKDFAYDGSVSLNCTGFANLSLSVWTQGNAHRAPYDSSQAVGGYDPLGDRFPVPAVNDGDVVYEGYCFHIDGIKNLRPNNMYSVGLCDTNGLVKHDVVYLNGNFYECNHDRTPSVYSTPFEERWERHRRRSPGGGAYICGPFI